MPVFQLLSCKMMKWVVARQKGGSMYAGCCEHIYAICRRSRWAAVNKADRCETGSGGQTPCSLPRTLLVLYMQAAYCLVYQSLKKKVISKSRRSVVISCFSINKTLPEAQRTHGLTP